jgi:hypothetical protein
MPNDEFNTLLSELRGQLLEASIHFEIWEGLWPTKDVIDVINRYKSFFLPSRNAHLDRFFIKVYNIVSNRSNQPSFYHVFSMINKDSALAPDLDVKSLRNRLKSHRTTLMAIEDYRNTRGAHWDTDIQSERKPILFGDCRRMLEELQRIFNEISGAATKNVWSFQPIPSGNTQLLLNHLKELRIIHQKQIEELRKKAES